ncbi:MAG: hypothetical protein H8D45_20810 [Bacteroidetes bacterium]|nr:hypothetical protein [Bacteroidota bacterium]
MRKKFDKQICAMIPEKLCEQIDSIALKQARHRADIIREAIINYFKENENG